jgi:hypothetical protein
MWLNGFIYGSDGVWGLIIMDDDDSRLSTADTEEDEEQLVFIMQHDYAMSEREDAITEMLEAYDNFVRDPWTGGWVQVMYD